MELTSILTFRYPRILCVPVYYIATFDVTTECVTDFEYRSEMNIFKLILIFFNWVSLSRVSWGSCINRITISKLRLVKSVKCYIHKRTSSLKNVSIRWFSGISGCLKISLLQINRLNYSLLNNNNNNNYVFKNWCKKAQPFQWNQHWRESTLRCCMTVAAFLT